MLSLLLALLLLAASVSADPCVFCTRGNITTPEKPVSIPGYEVLDSCGAVQSLAPAFLQSDDPKCELLQSLSTYCGCPTPADSCSLCLDGNPAPLQDKEVPWLEEQFQGIVPSCGLTEAYAASLSSDSASCANLQMISHHCGCAPIEDYCAFCNGEPLQPEFYDFELPFLSSEGITGTCQMFYEIQYQTPSYAEICKQSIHVTFHCGCNNGVLGYYGTETTRQQAALAATTRAVGSISLLGSLLVLVDIVMHAKKRRSVYHQLMALISCFDIVTACVWIVGPLAVERINTGSGLPWGIYGGKGNERTCQAQGYFFQLGFTSVFLCVSLAVYYLLVIVYGWRESRLKKYRLRLFGPPLLVGPGLSFAVIPFVDVGWSACQFNTYPEDEFLWSLLLFGIVPILGSTIAILCILTVIYYKVRTQRRKAQRWDEPKNTGSSALIGESRWRRSSLSEDLGETIPRRRRRRSSMIKDRLEREVLWQSMTYASAFSLTWPILMVAELNGNNFDYPYGFWIVVAIAAPLQGFSNALCYFRPCRRRSRQQRRNSNIARLASRSSDFPLANNQSQYGITALFQRHSRSSSTSSELRSGSMAEGESSAIPVDSLADDNFLSDPTVALANLGAMPEEEATDIFCSRTSTVEDAEGDRETAQYALERRLSETVNLKLETIQEALVEGTNMIGADSKKSASHSRMSARESQHENTSREVLESQR